MITRRNFLLGLRTAGVLALMPPALTLRQLKTQQLLVGSKGPELFRGSMKGVADGPIIRSLTPDPHSLSVENFTLTVHTETMETIEGGRFRIPTLADYSMEAWFRSEKENIFAYVGEPVHISVRARKDVFYSGNFLITEVRYEDNGLG